MSFSALPTRKAFRQPFIKEVEIQVTKIYVRDLWENVAMVGVIRIFQSDFLLVGMKLEGVYLLMKAHRKANVGVALCCLQNYWECGSASKSSRR